MRLLDPATLESGLFERVALAPLIDEHASGRFDHSQPLWLLLVFEGFLAGRRGAAALTAPRSLEAAVPA